MAAPLRHGLLRLKQISGGGGGGLGYGRRPPCPVQRPALGRGLQLQPSRTFIGYNLFDISYKTAGGVPGLGMYYYRHGNMVPSLSDHLRPAAFGTDRSFAKLIFGIDVCLVGLYALAAYEVTQFIAENKTTPSPTADSSYSSPNIIILP